MIAIAPDSVITTGTSQSGHSSCPAVLHHAALKTEPVAVDGQGSIELFYSGAVLQSTYKQLNSWLRVPTKLHQHHHAGIHIKLVVPNFST